MRVWWRSRTGAEREQEPTTRAREPRGRAVGTRGQECALETVEECGRSVSRASLEVELRCPTPRVENPSEPGFVVGIEAAHLLLHLGRKRREIRGEHPAEAEPSALLVGRTEQLDVRRQLGGGSPACCADASQCVGEPIAISRDQRATEVSLGGKVMMNARRPDPDALGEITIAEGVVPTRLGELLSDVEELIGGPGGVVGGRHAASLPTDRYVVKAAAFSGADARLP